MLKWYSKNGGETSSFGPTPVLAREVERPQSLRYSVGIIWYQFIFPQGQVCPRSVGFGVSQF